ncbi:Rrf2 family transcriptional regulator [Virgibacillus phasianinus]|uniref:HTH-type transcriptional regulator NsrR n=1 Tax=Virgibacillus phasianinus TaxID=2017483 RepID=A0A220U2Y6_9BACI|nr:Rrf2 family transcriptional regulator [Virgibacillus phasianinus]ASK62644.1 Rrf2 family transcriptional regulator [Virgibacillus phasianinus]
MQLKKYTDYALRVLIYTGTKNNDELASIKEISKTFAISQNHLGKVVFELNKKGYLETVRGRNGGIRLAKPPEEMNVGEIVREFEDDFAILECFDKSRNHCVITPACKLKHALNEAVQAFLQVLDDYTVNDLITNRGHLKKLMGID